MTRGGSAAAGGALARGEEAAGATTFRPGLRAALLDEEALAAGASALAGATAVSVAVGIGASTGTGAAALSVAGARTSALGLGRGRSAKKLPAATSASAATATAIGLRRPGGASVGAGGRGVTCGLVESGPSRGGAEYGDTPGGTE